MTARLVRRGWLIYGTLAALGVFLSACGPTDTGPFFTPTPAATFTPGPTEIPARPTEPPPGSNENPLNLYLVSDQPASAFEAEIETLETALAEATGAAVQVVVTGDYAIVLRGLCDRTVHMGTLDAFSYLSASERGCVTPVSIVERDGATSVEGQLIANSERRIESVEDFRGRAFCRPAADSAYGWALPGVTLMARGIDPINDLDTVINAGSDQDVVQMVHDGDCDVGATLLGAEDEILGLEDPDLIAFIEALVAIPNDVLVYGAVVPQNMREEVQTVFTANEPDISGVLDAGGLRLVSDADFDDLRDLFEAAGVDIVSLGQ